MTENGAQIRVGDLIHAMKKRWKLVAALTIVGVLAGLAMLGLSVYQGTYMDYEVTCSFAVTSQNGQGGYLENMQYMSSVDYYLAEDMVDAVSYVIKSDRVLSAAIESSGVKVESISQVSDNLTLSRYNETQIIEMTLDWNDEAEGIALENAILVQASAVLPQTLQIGAAAVINEPQAQYLFGGSMYAKLWILLGALGFLAGMGVAVLDLLLRPTLLNLNDVGDVFGLETIGLIPLGKRAIRKVELLENEKAAGPVEQNYASAAYILQNLLGRKGKRHCLYVTSAMDGEGKTTTAANLAVQLAGLEKKVLLVDLDTHNPKLGGLFLNHVEYGSSLNALYQGNAEPEDVIHSLTGYLDLLPLMMQKNALTIDSILLDYVQEISKEYDYVIIDAAPVGTSSGALSLNRIADSALLVVRYDTAIMQDIMNAVDKLRKSGIQLLGCIVNGAEPINSGIVRRSYDADRAASHSGREGRESRDAWAAAGESLASEYAELMGERPSREEQIREALTRESAVFAGRETALEGQGDTGNAAKDDALKKDAVKDDVKKDGAAVKPYADTVTGSQARAADADDIETSIEILRGKGRVHEADTNDSAEHNGVVDDSDFVEHGDDSDGCAAVDDSQEDEFDLDIGDEDDFPE